MSPLEKRFLVWTKKYKLLNDVPVYVPSSVMEKARSKMRIKVANLMIISTVIACFVVIKFGRDSRDRGDSLQKRNLEWHEQYKEEIGRFRETGDK